MKSVWLVVLANLRRRKKQSFLIGISVLISVTLLTTAIGIFFGIQSPFDAMFDRLKGSHILLYYDIRQNDAEMIKEWFQNQPEVEYAAPPLHYYLVTEPLMTKNQKVDIMVRMTEYDRYQKNYDKLLKINGLEEQAPRWGETWIPRHLAEKYQLKTGDTLNIPLANGMFPLIVSSIVIDPHYVNGLINPNRIWIAPGMLPFMVQTQKLNEVMQGIRLHNKNDIDNVWARFNREMAYSGNNLQYSLFKSVFTSVYKIIGLVLIIFALLAIIISVYMITSSTISSVLADGQLFGILKALGYTPAKISNIYLLQYAFLLIISIPSGLFISYLAIHTILRSVIKSIGLVNFNFSFFPIFISTSLFFILFILLLVYFLTGKAGEIPAAVALKSMASDTNIQRSKRNTRISIQKLRLTYWITWGFLVDSPRKTIFSLISLIITSFILGFAVTTSSSFDNLTKYKTLWGFDDSQLQVYRSNETVLPVRHEQFMQQMNNNEHIAGTVAYNYYEVTVPATGNIPPQKISGKVFEQNPSRIGLTNLIGKHPGSKNEISLCVGTATRLRKSVGDSINVLIENEPRTLRITGIYQDVSNMGEGFRLLTSAVKAVNPIFKPDHYALKLKDKTQTEAFKTFLFRTYGETIKIELTIEDQLNFMGVTKNISASMLLIAILFAGVLFVSVYNDISLNIWENRKTIGIYKLIGFTSTQLRNIMVIKTSIITITGMLLAIPLVAWASPWLLSSVTSEFGVVRFPVVFSVSGSLIAGISLIIMALMSAWLASGYLEKIHPRILVSE